jgi:hypothetical protein
MIVIEAKGGDLHGSNDTRTPREQRDTRDTSFDGIVASGGEEVSSTGAPTPCTLNACSTRAQAIIFYTTFLRAYISIAYILQLIPNIRRAAAPLFRRPKTRGAAGACHY